MEEMRMTPKHILLFLWCTIAALAGLCCVYPSNGITIGETTLRWTTLRKVLELPSPDDVADAETAIDSVAEVPSPATALPDTISLPAEAIPADKPLLPFFTALEQTSSVPVRVVHYGDSQIEEDRISMVLRQHLQTLYGGGGVGIVPVHQTIPSQNLHQQLYIDGKLQTNQQGPKRHLVYGSKSFRLHESNLYGPMGQVAIMNDSLVKGSEHLTLHLEAEGTAQPCHTFSCVRLWADSTISMAKDGDSVRHQKVLHFPDSTTSCTIQISGRGNVYGLSLETPKGVMVDNIPMRGCLGTVFTEMNASQLTSYFRTTHTALIIMQFGGNAIPFNTQESTIRGIVSLLRKQVQFMRSCAPGVSILFIGPSDMLKNEDGELKTHPLVPYMDRLLQRMAADEGIAYWSLYSAMGGNGSMIRWQEKGLAGQDGVHFTRRGAEKAGEMLWQWLMRQKDEYTAVPAPNDSIN
ncbi:MAG: hypothetical protein MJZ92_00130 [Paludibacteraceae bacterium]|nr:hypothetical protein [Paludibacteraceae bacterium]